MRAVSEAHYPGCGRAAPTRPLRRARWATGLVFAAAVLMAGCGKKRELLTIFNPALEPLARQWQEWFRNLKTELTWAYFPAEVPENAFVTLLHRAEAAAEGAAEDLTGRDIPVVSIAWDGTEEEVEAFFRLAGALAGQLEQKT